MNYYKKKLDFFKLCLFLFFTCLSFAQTQTTIQDYLNIEQVRLFKADSIEADITNYVQTNLPMYNLSAQTVSDVTNNLLNEHDATDNPIVGADLQTVLQQVKQNDLRSSYFNTHPNVSSFFNATVVPQELRIDCINGGFETGNTANYTFRTTVVNPTSHLTNGCSTSNFNAFAPSPLFNLYQNSATIVTPANEPFLAGLNININQVRTGNFALKINPNPNSVPTLQIGNSTSVSRDFMINGNTINFSFLHFGYVVNGHNQPTFRYRLYRIDVLGNIAGILREVCIPLTVNDCRYTRVSDNRLGVNTLSYTPNWVCQEINTGNLVGQNVRLEFTVSDCEYRGHFSTAYIDDLCGVDYPPTWGSIQLQNINLNCPRINFDVCGTFQLPASSSINSLVLNILNPSGAIVGTVLNPVITSVSNFCFTVNPSIFGANPNGNYTFQVIANLNGACTTPLMDISGNVTFSTLATPTFTQVANICSGATLSALPTTSTNGITGTWSPA
ncbi:MAG: hypothetical protein K2P85_03120, partial [Flavobacteriaceae bacterium]|nr:hypothetical protein [Flavobacteriaceae bacterium]